ncbi:MAG: hypothetical protein IKD04_06590 [Clostridia bacterium]|nr:hypothetical protein [Clostridia bacterium]
MKRKVNKTLSLLLSVVIVFSAVVCLDFWNVRTKANDDILGTSSLSAENIASLTQNTSIYQNKLDSNAKNSVFPIFSNDVDYTRGGATASKEEYYDYNAYIADRHEYADMIDHKSEVSAVRLAELGVFKKTENFEPDSSMTVGGFLKALMMVCGQDISGATSNSALEAFIDKTNFLEDGITVNYSSVLTNEQMAYFLSRATETAENYTQYKLLISDYEDINSDYRAGVLKMVKLGLIEIENNSFNPTAAAKCSDIADGLYRLINTGARLIPPYDLGDLYSEGQLRYLVKTSYNSNEAGTMLGFFSNYNHQAKVFENFGKLPVDRTDFYKWKAIEQSQGVYTWPNFGNVLSAHKLGQTTVINVDISANGFTEGVKNIPEFYTADITNDVTRAAAKTFLFEFVKKLLAAAEGDVLLLIDYELNYQQGIYDTTVDVLGPTFGEWFVEACAVAREAASAMGAADRLKLGVNYDGIGTALLLGPDKNQWMLDMAEAVNYVTVDTYQSAEEFSADMTNPAHTLQDLRYLMNNYSLDKPVMMLENGLKVDASKYPSLMDGTTGLIDTDIANGYWQNLFREYRFALERGDFLNANVAAYLIWGYNSGTNPIADAATNKLHPWGEIIKRGINLLYKQNQFNPSYVGEISNALEAETEISVSSGTEYQKLTYIVTDYKTDKDGSKLSVKLSDKGTVFVTVNGETNIVSSTEVKNHTIDISKGMRDGFNVIDIYFGDSQAPSVRTVEEITLDASEKKISDDAVILGDADDNLQVDIRDLIRTKKYAAYKAAEINLGAVDFDYDKKIKATDVTAVKEIILQGNSELAVNSDVLEDTY